MNCQGNQVQVYVVCGVCGSGKTSIAEKLKLKYNCEFIEGDELHPIENKEMMKQGIPLNDDNRWNWLDEITKIIKLKSANLIASKSKEKKIFVTCSALKRKYRERIENNLTKNEFLIWLYLNIEDRSKLKERIIQRKDHFMNANLIDSQFEILEQPNSKYENVIEIKVENKSIDKIVDELIKLIDNYHK